jgi:membrane protein implicated in regulation of membrane protease activity
MLRLMSLLASALIVEMVFFGPLGLLVAGIPIRKVLIAGLILCSVIPMLLRRTDERWQIWLLLSFVLFLAVWGFIVPASNGVDINMTLAEIQPFVALLLIFPIYTLFDTYGPAPYLKILVVSTAAMASIVIVLWFASNVIGQVGLGIAARDFYIGLNDSDIGVYIGPMPDGSFRIMLINFILFPIMMSYHNWNRFNPAWTAFYALAIFATGTRAFLGVAAIIIAASLLRRRAALAVPLLIIAGFFAVSYAVSQQGVRVFDFTSDLTSSSARYVQFFSLLNLFWSHPIFGAGFGASARVVRSIEAPYSYELTYVALLAKLGLIGAILVGGAMLVWLGRSMRYNPNRISIAALAIAVVLMTASNPYLINLVGMSIVAFLIAIGMWVNRPETPTYDSSGQNQGDY